MSRTKRKQKSTRSRERRISVRGIRRDAPDFHKLGRALLAIAQAEADAQKQREQEERDAPPKPKGGERDG
jgi:hypothetical protein